MKWLFLFPFVATVCGAHGLNQRLNVVVEADGEAGGGVSDEDIFDLVRRQEDVKGSTIATATPSLLEHVAGVHVAGSDSMFSFSRTRSLFTFRSFFGDVAPRGRHSAIFYVLVVFIALGCILSSVATVLSRNVSEPGNAEGSGGQEGLVERDLSCSPEGLEENVYGMGIAAIIRDAQRFAMKTELFSLRLSRVCITIFVLVFTMTLQVFLIWQMKHLVTSMTTNKARTSYDKFELAMYGGEQHVTKTVNGFSRGVDGYFDANNFKGLKDELKDSICQMPLSQPTFFIAILLIWSLICVTEIRRAVNLTITLLWNTPTIDNMAQSCEDTPQSGDEAVIVVGLTKTVKAMIAVFIIIPRIIVAGVLLWLGCRWLCGTMGFSDVLTNAVALEFILLTRDIFYNTMAPHHNQLETRNTLILPNSPNSDKVNPSAPAFLGAFLWGVLAIAWVLLYVDYFQQVLPEYKWDIHTVCAGYIADAGKLTK